METENVDPLGRESQREILKENETRRILLKSIMKIEKKLIDVLHLIYKQIYIDGRIVNTYILKEDDITRFVNISRDSFYKEIKNLCKLDFLTKNEKLRGKYLVSKELQYFFEKEGAELESEMNLWKIKNKQTIMTVEEALPFLKVKRKPKKDKVIETPIKEEQIDLPKERINGEYNE